MKARVKKTGEFIEVVPSIYDKDSYDGNDGYTYTKESLIILNDEPDYWEKLKHQYAGMAMQGILSNPDIELDFEGHEACLQAVAQESINLATALVNRFKEEEV